METISKIQAQHFNSQRAFYMTQNSKNFFSFCVPHKRHKVSLHFLCRHFCRQVNNLFLCHFFEFQQINVFVLCVNSSRLSLSLFQDALLRCVYGVWKRFKCFNFEIVALGEILKLKSRCMFWNEMDLCRKNLLLLRLQRRSMLKT